MGITGTRASIVLLNAAEKGMRTIGSRKRETVSTAGNSFEFESNPWTELHRAEGGGCYNRPMTNTIMSAIGGMHASTVQFEKAAQNVVKATSTGTDNDLSKAIVDSKTSEKSLKANVAVFKTADKMMGDLLDILA
jgi:hypothetical protein